MQEFSGASRRLPHGERVGGLSLTYVRTKVSKNQAVFTGMKNGAVAAPANVLYDLLL